jgi:hypothetical protein
LTIIDRKKLNDLKELNDASSMAYYFDGIGLEMNIVAKLAGLSELELWALYGIAVHHDDSDPPWCRFLFSYLEQDPRPDPTQFAERWWRINFELSGESLVEGDPLPPPGFVLDFGSYRALRRTASDPGLNER